MKRIVFAAAVLGASLCLMGANISSDVIAVPNVAAFRAGNFSTFTYAYLANWSGTGNSQSYDLGGSTLYQKGGCSSDNGGTCIKDAGNTYWSATAWVYSPVAWGVTANSNGTDGNGADDTAAWNRLLSPGLSGSGKGADFFWTGTGISRVTAPITNCANEKMSWLNPASPTWKFYLPNALIRADDTGGGISGATNPAVIAVTNRYCELDGIALRAQTPNGGDAGPNTYDGVDVVGATSDKFHLLNSVIASFANNITCAGTKGGGGGGGQSSTDCSLFRVYTEYGSQYNLAMESGATDMTVALSDFSFAQCNSNAAIVACPSQGGQDVRLRSTADTIILGNRIQNSGNNCGDGASGSPATCGSGGTPNAEMVLTGVGSATIVANAHNQDLCDGINMASSNSVLVSSEMFKQTGWAGSTVCTAPTSEFTFGGQNQGDLIGANIYANQTAIKNYPGTTPDYVYKCDPGAGSCSNLWGRIDPFPVTPASPLANHCIDDESVVPWTCGLFADQHIADITRSSKPVTHRNYITGFTFIAQGGAGTLEQINPGQATDSSNVINIETAWGATGHCNDDISTVGPGGLDTGSPASSTTYFFYVLSLMPGQNYKNGTGNAFFSCEASTSASGPALGFNTTGNTTSGGSSLSNVASIAGLPSSGGNFLVSDVLFTQTTTAPTIALGSQFTDGVTLFFTGACNANMANSLYVVDQTQSAKNQMQKGAIPANDQVASFSAPGGNCQVVLSSTVSLGVATGDVIAFGAVPAGTTAGAVSGVGPYTVAINLPSGLQVTATKTNDPVTFTNPYTFYRATGALVTDAGDTNFPKFQANEQTLAVNDIFTAYGSPAANTIGTAGGQITLAGVPTGIKLNVKGICSTTNPTLIQAGNYTGGLNVNGNFAPNGVFEFDAYTNASGQVTATASANATTVKCYATEYTWARGS